MLTSIWPMQRSACRIIGNKQRLLPLPAETIAVLENLAKFRAKAAGNLLIFPDHSFADRGGPIRCRRPLGGMLNYYDRAA